jgi:acetylornithine deacetylase/succinyl-diaminopimelate desuccinylase-like protein
MNELTELARRLVSIDSVNPDLVPGGAGEREIAQFVADWLRGAGLEVETVEAIVGLVRERAAEASGREPGYTGSAGWMDAALLAAAGIPTVVYGPGGSGAHAAVEWVVLDDLEVLRRVLLSTAEEFCA